MIDIEFLKQGGQKPGFVASKLADFILGAQKTLSIAIYDFRLDKDADVVLGALRKAVKKGVDVRIIYDEAKPSTPGSRGGFDESDPAPHGTSDFLAPLAKEGIRLCGVSGSHIMHHKYMIRDAHLHSGAVWTGTSNFTEDAWSLQENTIVQIESPDLCWYYSRDFGEIWHSGKIDSTGVGDSGSVMLEDGDIEVFFAPGQGRRADTEIASLISNAERVKIASMVLSSGIILGALCDVVDELDEFSGIYDGSNMENVVKQWQTAKIHSKIAMFDEVSKYLVSKPSTPYSPTSKHDYMHNKLAVIDDTVVVGSLNFSESATHNAENVLFINDPELADQCSEYIDEISSMYGKKK